ncbi:cytochrome c oxidase assembly protein [Planosporangium sp. 12N6]|uniref:cytochrome c oxidase assembly protein n=1 Tax=Planosporangium spinosum TaxID=3402278 RepID=UPI003CF48CB7
MQYQDPALTILAHGGDDEPLAPLRAGTLFRLELDPWLAVALLAVAIAYLYAVWRLERRGDRWPALRTVSFVVAGLGGIASVTLTGIGTYDTTLLSVHMVQHMVLSMIAPIFLALGAPVTLALRTLPHGPRRVLLSVVHSRVAKIWTYPLFAYGLFVVTPFALYFTGLYELTMRNTLVHELVHLHFIGVGCLFFWPLLGIDPLPGRWPYPGRALLMFLSTPFHTVLGLTVMQSTTLLGGDWYPSLRLGWADPFTDQRLAGGILWAGGEVVSVTMLGVLVVQWMRHAEREARRLDRRLDREEMMATAPGVGVAQPAGAAAPGAVPVTGGAVPTGNSPEAATGAGERDGGGYDPLGSRDTQGASSR